MVTAAPTRYNVPHGATCYAGKSNPAGSSPAWRQALAPGHFANISTNTPTDVRPAGWPTGDVGGPTQTWIGGTLLPEYSTLGAYATHGSGHQSNDTDPEWAGVLVFDYSTLAFTLANAPPAPMKTGLQYYNPYGENIESGATAGYTKTPHTYTSIITRGSADGGGAKGSVLRVGFMWGVTNPGSHEPIHQFDLSPTGKPVRLADDVATSGGYLTAASGVYAGKSGFWLLNYYGSSLHFYPWNNLASPISFPSVAFNIDANAVMRYIPELNCLVAMGELSGNVVVFVSKIVSGTPQPFTQVTTSGTTPNNTGCGFTWWPSRGGLYSYEGGGSFKIHKLTLSADLSSGSWANETMVGDGGAVPAASDANRGSWGRMAYNPATDCLGWVDGSNNKFQAWLPSI